MVHHPPPPLSHIVICGWGWVGVSQDEAIRTMVQAPEDCAEKVGPDPAVAEAYRDLYHRYLERSRPTPHERRTSLGQHRGLSTSARARGNDGDVATQPAAFIHGKMDVRLGELPVPVAGTGSVLLAVFEAWARF